MRRREALSGWAGGAWPEVEAAPPQPPETGDELEHGHAESRSRRPLPAVLRGGWARQTLLTAALIALALAAVRLPGAPGETARRAVAWALHHDVDLPVLERQASALGRRLGLETAGSTAPAAPAAVPVSGALATPMGPLVLPVDGQVTAWFGWGVAAGRPWFNPGLDWRVQPGAPVRAVSGGTVVSLAPRLVLEHVGGWQSVYGNCTPLDLAAGQAVRRGQIVCRASGSDLFFQLSQGGQAVDPAPYLGLHAPTGQ